MVSDASSGDSRRADLERDKVPVKGADGMQPRSTADLTHELAQLLAATIAQRQLNSGLPATLPPPLNLAGTQRQPTHFGADVQGWALGSILQNTTRD